MFRPIVSPTFAMPPAQDPFSQPPPGEWMIGKVTAIPTAGQYTFDEYWLNGDGSWVQKVGGVVGTSSRYGVALSGTFAVNDYVWFRAAPGAGGELFELLATAAGSGTVTSITTKESDGSPSYTFTTTVSMEFDQATGHKLSQPAAGRVKMELLSASATQVGVVDTTTQTFGGDKTFDNDIYNTAGTMYAGAVLTVGTLAANYNNAYYTPIFYVCDGFADGGGTPINALDIYSNNTYTTTADRVFKIYGGTATTTKPGEVEINGVIQFAGISDANAPNSSLYYSTTANKLVYKDGGGTVNNLY